MCVRGCVPSYKDAQQVNVISPCQQHSHTQSQFEHEEPADNLVDAVALAQRQEVQVVQVRGNVRDTCMGAEAKLGLNEGRMEKICSQVVKSQIIINK